MNRRIIERLVIIVNRIKSGAYPNTRDLCEFYKEQTGMEVSVPTISRDLDTLRTHFGAPILFSRERNGYYFSDNSWQFSQDFLSADTIFYLSAAKTLLSFLPDSPIYRGISDAICFITGEQDGKNGSLMNRIAVPPKPKFCVDDDVWKKILVSIRENRVLRFDYKNRGKTEFQNRRVRPYQILFDNAECFLFGFSEERQSTRLFSVPRIKNPVVTADSFELPEDFDFASKCSLGKFGAYADGKKERYVIDFYEDSRDMVKDCIWADDQKITDFDDFTRIEFSSEQSEKVLEWVLSQGANAVPVYPPSLCESWKDNIELMADSISDSEN